MGGHFLGNLTHAFRTVAVSRKRTLQLLRGALAVAVPARLPEAAEAGRRPSRRPSSGRRWRASSQSMPPPSGGR
jgi:hypothetical protein